MPLLASTLDRLQYGFDRDSRRTWRQRVETQGFDQHFGYDGLSQVTGGAQGNLNLNRSAISGVPAVAEAWDYDPTGNWRGYHVDENGAVSLDQHRVHDKGNRLTQIEGDSSAILLDRAGRMLQVPPNAAGDWDEPVKLQYDAWSRITEVMRASDDTVLAKYGYDGLGRRTKREVDGVVHQIYYSDTWRPVEERKNDETTASVQYLWGTRHRDDLVRQDRATGGSTTLNEKRYVLMDYYSPAAITDETGTVTERYAFSAFGVRQILAPDFSPRSTSECGFEFAFQGQFEDVETGYLNYGYRYYVPWLGRWTCKDPIGIEGGVNLYGMVDNGVVNRVDFLGLVPRGELGPPPSEVSSDPTLNKVASDLLNTALAQPNSGYSGIEYCGLICVKCKKGSKPEYAYTGPYPGTTGDCDPFQGGTCKENFTDEWKLAGTYHTHPDSLPPSRPPGGQDTSYTNNVRVPTFVGGPKKDFWRHDPGTDKSTGKPNEPRTIPRLSH